MDALVRDVAKVVQILNEHSVPSFEYNENIIFERLEICTFKHRVQMVAEALLVELDVPVVAISGQREAAPQIVDNRMQIDSECAVLGQVIAVEATATLPFLENHIAGLPTPVSEIISNTSGCMSCSGSTSANMQEPLEELSDKTLLPSYPLPASPAFTVQEHLNVCQATRSQSEDSLNTPRSPKVARLDLSVGVGSAFTSNVPVSEAVSNAIDLSSSSTLLCKPPADSQCYNFPALQFSSTSGVMCEQPVDKVVKQKLETPTSAIALSVQQYFDSPCTVTSESDQHLDMNTNANAESNQLFELAHAVNADLLFIPALRQNKIPLDDGQASCSMPGSSNQNSAKAEPVKLSVASRPTIAVSPHCIARSNVTSTVTSEENQYLHNNTNVAAELLELIRTVNGDVLTIPAHRGNKIPLDDGQASCSRPGTSKQNSAKADLVKPRKQNFDLQPTLAILPHCIVRTNGTRTVTCEGNQHLYINRNMAAESNQFVDSTCAINADVLSAIPALGGKEIPPMDDGQANSRLPQIRPYPKNPHRFLSQLKIIFPSAAIDFLEAKCRGVSEDDNNALYAVIDSILIENDYPKREPSPRNVVTVAEQYESLREILPNADPTFLYDKCEELIGNEAAMKTFVASALEKRDYPTMASYKARLEEAELNIKLKEMLDNFSIEKFLSVIPDPQKYFSEMKREEKNIPHYVEYLKHKHRCVRVDTIRAALKMKENNLYNANKKLERCPGVKRGPRNANEIAITWQFEPNVLHEVCFIENEKKFQEYYENKRIAKEIAFKQAKEKGEFLECGCCFNGELLPEEVNACTEGHVFCIECIKKGAEVLIGDGKCVFPCLTSCEGEFTLDTLKGILQPSVFSKVVIRKQIDEVKAAEIPGLEVCPFCDFATIPNEQDRIFKCLNRECMKESCRFCRKESHIPLRCDEVEENQEVKMRTYIEDKMTDALIRVCWKCSKKFIKEDGCNKMTCTCGAKMCYVCRKPVKDYSHFNGPGADAANLCPLYTDNNVLHVDAILEVGNHAKNEALAQNPTFQLKNDPTKVLPQPSKPKRLPAGVVDQRDLVLQHNVQFCHGQFAAAPVGAVIQPPGHAEIIPCGCTPLARIEQQHARQQNQPRGRELRGRARNPWFPNLQYRGPNRHSH